LSNVIKDHRARLGSMREKNDHKNSSHESLYSGKRVQCKRRSKNPSLKRPNGSVAPE
jgi:hypothetical protein